MLLRDSIVDSGLEALNSLELFEVVQPILYNGKFYVPPDEARLMEMVEEKLGRDLPLSALEHYDLIILALKYGGR